ncbi:NACHT domain-containing protein [Terracoccus luteus]|uniref:Adenylate kinase family enzyme n=1 Tax=Terracoccus luteus TaxID=53356 RepID=A0A839Q2F5_9MICO|nr:NACHT domain-containing protein [Terracoccus luteus]MBB2988515.1 adenylate kinase family enzyme [Terracoccus luteus]MCP2174165.1 adenylate kinase family enzyme [Terracoccus luteus]
MSLGPTHFGYYFQDLVTGVALVDLLLGTAKSITVDTKGFDGDRFDDVNIVYTDDRRVRLQIKHTTTDRLLSKETFSQDKRHLKLNKVLDSLLTDLASCPGTTYRIVVRDSGPDDDLSLVLLRLSPADRPDDPLPGITTQKYRFDPDALQRNEPWATLVGHLSSQDLRDACDALTVDTDAPAASINFSDPGPAERVLLRRVRDELGAGRPPNSDVSPEFAAHALALAATSARVTESGVITRDAIDPRLGLRVDFGAVSEGHPVDTEFAVAREGAATAIRAQIGATIAGGGRVVVVGGPGTGKSWLSEQLAETYREDDWIVARHHCWLGADDANRQERVLADVVIGSLLDQLGRASPEATKDLRPKYATSAAALEQALKDSRDAEPGRNVLLIVDGLDHVDRVVGLSTSQSEDPSRLLVKELAAVTLQPGVCLVIASQPGAHLDPAAPVSDPVQMPPMSWDEIKVLAKKHGLLESPDGSGPVEAAVETTIVGLIHDRSRGNALYATYLCKLALGTSPYVTQDGPVTANDLIYLLERVPDTATTVEEYYDYLRGAMTDSQIFATDTLALCDFALTPDELGEVLGKPIDAFVLPALRTLAPVLNTEPGLGGLRLHHESFARHILRTIEGSTAAAIRNNLAGWLKARGFLADSRAFRHLPGLLAALGNYDELKALVGPPFVAHGITALHSPAALQRVLIVVAREAEMRLDWPTLITCVELRKALDTYENGALSDTIIEYADVVVSVVGADHVAERLLYDGQATFPPRWGLRILDAVDKAGVAAPWKAYLDAWATQERIQRSTYSSDDDGTLQLALQRGALRLRAQRGGIDPSIIPDVAEHLEGDHQASLRDLVATFAACLPAEFMTGIADAMTDPTTAAHTYLALADLAACGTTGLPDPAELATTAWSLDPTADAIGFLIHGITPQDLLIGLGIADLEADLDAATDLVLEQTYANEEAVKRWLTLTTLAQAIDPTLPVKVLGKLSGAGFYRAWLRYTIATGGLLDDVRRGFSTPEDASTAVTVALTDLASEAKPFIGKPRACDLYSIHDQIHQVVEDSLLVVQPTDLDAVLDHLVAIGDGTTTTTNFGLAANGPLTTNALLAILSRAAAHIGTEAVHALVPKMIKRRDDHHSIFGTQADFELEIARICVAAGDLDQARECWNRTAGHLANYGGHKDPTLSEIVDSLKDIKDVTQARERLGKVVDLVYLVRQHTNGRDTSHYATQWWEIAASIDPVAAARDAADLYLDTLGFEDARADSAHTKLLQVHATSADPAVLAALRLTTSPTWRSPHIDLEVLTRLKDDLGISQPVDRMLAVIANAIAGTYDNLPMQYSSEASKEVVDADLIDAVIALGGSGFTRRTARADEPQNARFADDPRPKPSDLVKRLVAEQQPAAPEGRAGAMTIAQAIDRHRYRDDETPTPTWTLDAATNMIGYRILEASIVDGPEAGIALVNDVAREISTFNDQGIFVALGEGLAAHHDDNDAVATVASYCLTTAYERIRGGGGWRQFAGRERRQLWVQAHDLDPDTAERVLAAAVTQRVTADSYRSYGTTQGLVAAFAARPTRSPGGTPIQCWDASYTIIKHRLPGTAEPGTHVYHPTPAGESAAELDTAVATLAVSTIAQASREQIRLALLGASFLLTLRPTIGQAAIAYLLQCELDAGRTTWLLEVIQSHVPTGDLEDDLANSLTKLAAGNWLSTRVLAARILKRHGRPVPELPATAAAPHVTAAIQTLLAEQVGNR